MKPLSLTERQFLSLLKAGIWLNSPDIELFKCGADWMRIYEISRKQTVFGVVYDGILQLPSQLRPPRDIMLQWFAGVVMIEKLNKKVNETIDTTINHYRQIGLNPILLKGQGLAQYYFTPSHRQPGDIDLYFGEDYAIANQEASCWGENFNEETLHHLSFTYQGISIENHCRYVYFYSNKNMRHWNNWIHRQKLIDNEHLFSTSKISVPIFQPTVNILYVFLHLQHHLLNLGVGLRQVCDWLYLLHTCGDKIDTKAFEEAFQLLPIQRTLPATLYICEHYLGLRQGCLPINSMSSQAQKDGELILRDIMFTGNFGHHTSLWDSLSHDKKLTNIKPYKLAVGRWIRLYQLCPSEISAYPFKWVAEKWRTIKLSVF